jgi:hypothetical protein
MGNELVLHCGASEATLEELRTIEAPPPTKTWYPVKHSAVLDAVGETLDNAGFSIEQSWLSLSEDKNRFFAVLHLGTALAEGVSLSVGVRNSTDKSFPLGLVAGSRTFVCDNLGFSSEIVVAKRHTKFGERRYREEISNAMPRLRQFSEVETNRIAAFRERGLASAEADSIMLQAFEKDIVGTRLLPKLISEWRSPRHEEFKPRTAYSLLNCFTEVVKPRFKSHPNRAAYEMMRFQSLLN